MKGHVLAKGIIFDYFESIFFLRNKAIFTSDMHSFTSPVFMLYNPSDERKNEKNSIFQKNLLIWL